jgi:hypothetical protein
VGEEDKCIPFARRIRFGDEEGVHEFGCVRNEVLKLSVDRVDCEYGVLAYVGVAVFEAGSTCGDEGLKEFRVFCYFLQESQTSPSDIFIRMLL